MGIPSLSIVFHEILKLLHHAGATDVKFFRLGTSGGLGLEPGSVVISQTAKDGLLRPYMEVVRFSFNGTSLYIFSSPGRSPEELMHYPRRRRRRQLPHLR